MPHDTARTAPPPETAFQVATSDRAAAAAMPLDEMLRIMDVARELRLSREAAETELEHDGVRAALRERLLKAAAVTGDPVAPEEIDVAIERYFDTQHVYEDPPLGVEVALAHLYVRRAGIVATAAGITVVALLIWGVFFSGASPWSARGRTQRAAVAERQAADAAASRAQAAGQSVRAVASGALAIAQEPEAREEIERLAREAEAYASAGNLSELTRTKDRLDAIQALLAEEYEVHIVAGPGRKSGIDRYADGGKTLSGVYLIVEARAPNGAILRRQIRNREENQTHDVDSWGEQVPQEVYDRVKKDKQSDGVLDQTLFAVKRRGHRNEEVVFPGPDGKPLGRMGRITSW